MKLKIIALFVFGLVFAHAYQPLPWLESLAIPYPWDMVVGAISGIALAWGAVTLKQRPSRNPLKYRNRQMDYRPIPLALRQAEEGRERKT